MRLVYTAALLFITCFLFPCSVAGQTDVRLRAIAEIESGLSAGSTEVFAPYLSQNVGITMSGTTRTYDRNQALYVLRQFMSDFPSNGFHILYEGNSGGTAFASGVYKSTNGGTFEINIFVKVSGGTIDEIRIDRG
ncbi:MAG: DUF4783 domain-containing protein [Bacteroidia bacterium]|nr:DUF4783 domain-containing protein [Bacteroidia bacterium]